MDHLWLLCLAMVLLKVVTLTASPAKSYIFFSESFSETVCPDVRLPLLGEGVAQIPCIHS